MSCVSSQSNIANVTCSVPKALLGYCTVMYIPDSYQGTYTVGGQKSAATPRDLSKLPFGWLSSMHAPHLGCEVPSSCLLYFLTGGCTGTCVQLHSLHALHARGALRLDGFQLPLSDSIAWLRLQVYSRVFWAPARLWPGCLPDQNRRSHAPYLRLLSVQVDAGNLSVQCIGTMEEFRLADFLDHGSRSSRYAPHRASFCPRSFTGMVFPLLGALTCARDMDAVYLVLPSMSLTPPQQHHSQLLTLTILPGTRRLSCKHDPVCMLSKIQLDGSLLRTFTVFHTESASPAHTEVFQLTSAGLDG